MEKLAQYRGLIRQLLNNHAKSEDNSLDSEIECQLIFDTEHDHYQLLDIGWDGLKRVYNCFIHIDIKDSKVWIQRNMTEADIAKNLVEMGIPKEDIIIGLHQVTNVLIQVTVLLSQLSHVATVFEVKRSQSHLGWVQRTLSFPVG